MREQEYAHPLVSVIIPAYACEKTIQQAIDSALVQGVPLEILVSNDCSPDDLDAVMWQYRSVRQVRYCKNRNNLGVAATRNRGVKMAKGRYVAFLEADDWWEKDKLRKQLDLLEPGWQVSESGTRSAGARRNTKDRASRKPGQEEMPVLCACSRELVTAEGKQTGRVIHVHERISYRRLLLHNCINCSSVVLRTDVARKYPMQHEDSHEDYITWIRILREYGYAVAVDERLLKYPLDTSGKSGNKLKSAKMTYQAYRYAGFRPASAACLFCAYAVNGVLKYARAYLSGKSGDSR
ncbi:MAG: glycosyltransferase [Lachnospiraceae bacterium]|nr:glycosyltransferase [Lachnospiraceae bacterium]